MHYYSFHPSDYLKDTAHLSLLEDVTYRRLIDFYYQSEAPIPVGTQSVARRLRLDTQTVDLILSEFFELREDGWHQSRCDDEIAAYHALCERNRINGKAGGRRKKTQSQPTGNPVATQMGSENKANQKPEAMNHEPSTRNHEPKASGKTPSGKSKPITDEYLAELQESYSWVKIRQEFTKALKWCQTKDRNCSRQFFINWIEKIAPPPTAKPIEPRYDACLGDNNFDPMKCL